MRLAEIFNDMADDKLQPMITERPLTKEADFGVREQALPEQKEGLPETEEGQEKNENKSKENFVRPITKRKPAMPVPQLRDEVAVKIEKILEDGIGDAYSRLSPVAKQEFKLRGEETAQKIRILLQATHVKVKKIFRLILEWLKMLPGINKFFLEQEAKIKTDKIIAISKRK